MKEAGTITLIDPGADRPILEVGTLQCVHCGGHFQPRPGSGIERGFCMNCNGPVCGRSCEKCVPVEQYLWNMEHNQPDDFRPVIVPVSFTS